MSKKTKNQTQDDSVDQIRNILFGEQVKIFENKFDLLENQLTKTIEQLSNKVDQAVSELNRQIERASSDSKSDHSDLAEQHAKDIQSMESTLKDKIIETESDLLNQIQSGLNELESKASHRNDLAILLKDMAEKLAD